jgi:hypothetical protein
MTDEELRIQGYLRGQGAKLSPAQVIDKIRAAMAQLQAAATSVPAARFDERPEPQEWSGNEVMAHVLDAGRHFGDAIVAILDGRPGREARETARGALVSEPRTAGEWCALLERDRSALFERVGRADPATRLEATIEHGMFGPLNWREALLFLRLHDLDHAGQLQKIAAALTASSPA